MKLAELLKNVREQNLSKTKLEELYTEFLNLFSSVELRMADLEKLQALALVGLDGSVASGYRTWNGSPEGQELITLKRESRVIEKQLSSVKHRIYSTY